MNPPIGIIKLNMPCTATSSYLTLLPYYHDESKLNIQDQFIDNLISNCHIDCNTGTVQLCSLEV